MVDRLSIRLRASSILLDPEAMAIFTQNRKCKMVDKELAELADKVSQGRRESTEIEAAKKQHVNNADPIQLAKDWREHTTTCMQCRDPANPCDFGRGIQSKIPAPIMKEFLAIMGNPQIKKIILETPE